MDYDYNIRIGGNQWILSHIFIMITGYLWTDILIGDSEYSRNEDGGNSEI